MAETIEMADADADFTSNTGVDWAEVARLVLTSRAMDELERAYDQRAGAISGIKSSFLFTALRDHPRFTALLRKMKLA